MAFTTIDDPSKHFQTHLWTGDGNDDRNITFDGNSDMQPDLFVFNRRPVAASISWIDSTRGVTKELFPGADDEETTVTNRFQAFQSDGFQAGTNNDINATSNNTYISWAWKANGGTTTTISAGGDIGRETVSQVNTTAGFDICTYTGSGSQTSFGHSLGVAPDAIIIKNRDQDDSWFVWHNEIGNNQALVFDTNSAVITNNSYMGNEAPQSTWVGLGTGSNTNADGEKYVAYCWNEVKGFSKFGKYQGNNNADGPFVFLGFRPEFLLIKKTDATANWISKTGKVSEHNVHPKITYWDISNAENTAQDMDLLSNGFKHRSSEGDGNGSNTYVYFAWARTPMVTSKGTPGTAV